MQFQDMLGWILSGINLLIFNLSDLRYVAKLLLGGYIRNGAKWVIIVQAAYFIHNRNNAHIKVSLKVLRFDHFSLKIFDVLLFRVTV